MTDKQDSAENRPDVLTAWYAARLAKFDTAYLLKGILLYCSFIVLGYAYIASFGHAYVKKLEDGILTETVAVTKTPQSPTEKAQNSVDTPKTGSNREDFTKNPEPVLLEGLLENTNIGQIPKIRKTDNMTSFRAYQAPYDLAGIQNKKALAFAVKDYGLSEKLSMMVLEILPPEVSLILSPYAKAPEVWIAKAQLKGHEVWLSLPIQSRNAPDHGKNTIFHHAAYGKKRLNAYKILSQSSGYIGIAAYTDDTINYAAEDYLNFIEDIYGRGLGYLELNSKAQNLLASKALLFGAPYLKADINIINITGKNSLTSLEKNMLTQKTHAIAIVEPYPQTVSMLKEWIEKIGHIEYAIVPVSTIYDVPSYKSAQNANEN